MTKTRSIARPNLPFALLLACALLVRVLIPAGWMPAAQGGFSFILCSGWASAKGTTPVAEASYRTEMAGRLTPAGKGDDHGRGVDQPCAFSGLAAPWTAAESLILLLVPVLAAAPLLPPLLVAVGRGLAAPPPPSTGPPFLI